MLVIAKYIRMRQVQKVAQQQDTSAVNAHDIPVRVLITQGITADCTQAGCLIEGLGSVPIINRS